MALSLPWLDPLTAAASLTRDQPVWALLYSGQQHGHTGRYSYLALYPRETVSGDRFASLEEKLSSASGELCDRWFGYFGYELLHDLEALPRQRQGFITLPELWFARFGFIAIFDHDRRTVEAHCAPGIAPPFWPHGDAPWPKTAVPPVETLASATSKENYLASVEETLAAIARGDFYQANITRKFTGTFGQVPGPLALFAALCQASPAAYSACLCLGEASILSSSPERFLTLNADGELQTRPIKGTAPKLAEPQADARARSALAQSAKDRAENLMIVDLMRNDFARVCEPGSVRVEGLFEVSSYATLHHMASTVRGRLRAGVTALDAVKACFPPGSMTGAPKVRAVEWCLAQEPMRRGVYSGALGWLSRDSCDLSVVIRTLVLQGERFEFQVGGGIVADSDPESEWRETMVKARGICRALGVEMQRLERI